MYLELWYQAGWKNCVVWLLPGLAPASLLVGIHVLGENIRQGVILLK